MAARTASETIAEHIRLQIATGELRPGDTLASERALIETMQVARPTLRGALRILESDGLISIDRGRTGGARIVEPEIPTLARRVGLHLQLQGADLRHVIEAQTTIQLGAVACAASARDDDDLTRLSAAVDRCARAASAADLIAAAEAFSEAIIRAGHNPVLSLYADLTTALLRQGLDTYVAESGVSEGRVDEAIRWSAAQFAALVELIAAGDSAQAEAFWRSYLQRAGAAPSTDPSPFEMYRPTD